MCYCQTKMILNIVIVNSIYKKSFKELLRTTYPVKEIEYIDEFIEGRYLKDIIG